jgi:NifU-like protein involved in Fe-S cluster formation
MAQAMNVPLYTTEILRLAAELPEPRALGREDGRSDLRSPTCGSRVGVAVQLKNGRVEAISADVQACAYGQASSALMVASAVGKNRTEVAAALQALQSWLDGTAEHPGAWPRLHALEPARTRASRHGAILLPFRTLLAAMDDAHG